MLRGYDRFEVDDLIARAEAALASGDPVARKGMARALREAAPMVVLRGYDRTQVDEAFRLLADRLSAPPTP